MAVCLQTGSTGVDTRHTLGNKHNAWCADDSLHGLLAAAWYILPSEQIEFSRTGRDFRCETSTQWDFVHLMVTFAPRVADEDAAHRGGWVSFQHEQCIFPQIAGSYRGSYFSMDGIIIAEIGCRCRCRLVSQACLSS